MGHQHSHQKQHKHSHDCQHNHNTKQNYNKPSNTQQSISKQNSNSLTPNPQNIIKFKELGGDIFVDKTKKVFIREIQILEFEYKATKKLLENRIHLKHPNFITVKNFRFESIQDQGNQKFLQKYKQSKGYSFLYPSSHILKIQFEPVVMSVQGLIKMYCKQRKPLQQQQIRRIMKSTVQCLLFLKQNCTFHGDIKTTTIFIHPKTRQIKLVDSFLFHRGKTAYEIILQDTGAQSFLTPEQLQKHKQKKPESLENVYESEVFCVGMTLLEMMTFVSSMQAYNLEILEIKPQFVEKKMIQMEQYGYSFQLADLALRCIHKNKKMRPKFQDILRAL